MAALQITRQMSGPATVLTLRGSVDAHTYRALGDACALATAPGARGLVVEMSGVDYISSAGCGVLIGAYSTLEARRGGMVIVGLRPPVTETFAILGLTQVFAFARTTAEAVRRLEEATRPTAVG